MSEALYDAIVSRDGAMVSGLLKAGVNPNKVFQDGRTPLNTAIAGGDDVIISLLITQADISRPDSFRTDCRCLQPIHYAALYNRLDLIENFLSWGIQVDQSDEGNCTPLHHAAVKGNINIILFLIEVGSDINWQSNSGRTALWKAAQNGHRDVVQLLYAMGGDLNLQNKVGETVLFECICLDSLLPITQDLLELGIDVTIQDIEGNTALHKAAASGKHKAAWLLIKAGVNVDMVNDYGNTALHNAAMHNHTSPMPDILNHGMCASVRNKVGQSALYAAMVHQQTDATRLLHETGQRLSKKELRKFIYLESARNARKEQFWLWCCGYMNKPKDLVSVCRCVIRQSLNVPPAVGVPRLPVPVALQKYLLLADLAGEEIKRADHS